MNICSEESKENGVMNEETREGEKEKQLEVSVRV